MSRMPTLPNDGRELPRTREHNLRHERQRLDIHAKGPHGPTRDEKRRETMDNRGWERSMGEVDWECESSG